MYYSGMYDTCCYPGGYAGGVVDNCGGRNGFALIVVLFILLIIIGACWCFPN